MTKIGFIGLGIMGQPMARNLVKSGFPVTVFNRTASKCGPLVALGAGAASTPREAARRSDVVITIVSDAPDVDQVLFGSDGAAEGLKPGAVVIDMSTISPRAAAGFAERLKAKRCEMLDAPVSGGEKGANEATLAIMAGGKCEVFDQSLQILQALGKTIVYTGPSGSGQKTKMVNQIMCALNLLATVEGLRLGAAAGLDLPTTLNIVSRGVAGSALLDLLGPKILAGDFAPGFRIALHQKDLRLASELTREVGGSFPGTELSYSLFTEAVEKGLGEQGNQGLFNLWPPCSEKTGAGG